MSYNARIPKKFKIELLKIIFLYGDFLHFILI